MRNVFVQSRAVIRDERASSGTIRFAPVRSRCTLDVSDAKFAQSDAFAKQMDAAHAFAVRANYCYR